MIAESGHVALWLAAAFALLGLVVTRLGEAREFAVTAVSLSALLALCALLALVWSVESADFSLLLIDDRIHRLQPPLVRLAALARSPGGWLLTTATLVGGAATVSALLGRHAPRFGVVLLPLLAATLALDPFARQSVIAPEGRALWLPTDLGAALAGPLMLAAAVAATAVALARGGWHRPPRWIMVAARLGFAGSIIAGAGASLLAVTATAPLKAGWTIAMQGLRIRMVDIRPVAGPGFTAIEARLAVDNGGAAVDLRPALRTMVGSSETVAVPSSARLGGGRIEAQLLTGSVVRLSWRPLL